MPRPTESCVEISLRGLVVIGQGYLRRCQGRAGQSKEREQGVGDEDELWLYLCTLVSCLEPLKSCSSLRNAGTGKSHTAAGIPSDPTFLPPTPYLALAWVITSNLHVLPRLCQKDVRGTHPANMPTDLETIHKSLWQGAFCGSISSCPSSPCSAMGILS